jgi:RNA polymerase sigma factor (sigma-70 family)
MTDTGDSIAADGTVGAVLGSPFDEIVRLIVARETNQEKWAAAYAACKDRATQFIRAQWPRLSEQADDVLHSACLKAITRIRRNASVDNPGGWFYSILARTAAKAAETLFSYGARSVSMDVSTLQASEHGDSRPLPDECRLLELAIQRLAEEQRRVITLAYFERRGNSELAKAFGRSVPAVKSLRWRALESLRGMLKGENHGY